VSKGWNNNGLLGIGGGVGAVPNAGVKAGMGGGGGRVAAAPAAPSVVSNSSGNYSRPVSPPAASAGPMPSIAQPAPPSINAYLGMDTTYQQQVRDFQRALADYLSQETVQRSKINEDYGSATKVLGTQKDTDLQNLQSDYASRGLLTSGLFADANAKYNDNYLAQLAELTKNQRRGLADLTTGETQFRNQQKLSTERAREQAIARRAAKFSL